ncbi:hypothetical protein Tco_1302018 [Tanacetum coccineum]
MSPSIGVSSSTEASGSKPRSNTKKDRITQTSSSKKKTNKVEDQPRISKSSLNNTNRVSKEVCNANVKRSVLNVNSKLICATCHEFMFDAIHGLCVSDYLNDVNARVKSKSVKSRSAKCKKKEMWKPTGTDKTKITRKPSKMGKHGLEKQKSTREPKIQSQSQRKSTSVNYSLAIRVRSFSDPTDVITPPMIGKMIGYD